MKPPRALLRSLDALHVRMNAWTVFGIFLVPRILFAFFSGTDHYSLNTDSHFIERLSDGVLSGNFDFDIGRFIVAPFYQFFLAGHKWIFGTYWEAALTLSQCLLASYAGVHAWHLARLLFHPKAATLAVCALALFPFSFWWVSTFATESVFHSLFLISMSLLVSGALAPSMGRIVLSAVVFSIAFLTKSHLLLLAPFVVLYLRDILPRTAWIKASLLYSAICISATVPFGVWNLKHHGVYVLSSNGAPFQFYLGHSEFGYRAIVDVPQIGSEGFDALRTLDLAYYNGAPHDSLMALPQREKQAAFFRASLDWIAQHPANTAKLAVYNTAFYLLPGVSFRHYPLTTWLATFLLSLPFYVAAYAALVRMRGHRFRQHRLFRYVFLVMFLFSVTWYVQNRFRTITSEPFMLLYGTVVIAAWCTGRETTYYINRGDTPLRGGS